MLAMLVIATIGIIEHEEIMGNSIHLYEVHDAYCSCVTNVSMYLRIAIDIAKRWVSSSISKNNNLMLSFGYNKLAWC